MNFFGHAAVAVEVGRNEPTFALGSMLPDFGSIIAARIESVPAPEVAAGVAFHHHIDAIFHECEGFRALSSASFAWFEAREMSRGSARALAHVGVELLLDRTLAREPRYRDGYMAAFSAAEHARAIVWTDLTRGGFAPEIAASDRLTHLLERLSAFGVDLHECSLVTLGDRLRRILSRRPRLALSEQDATHVVPWLEAFEIQASGATPQIMQDLLAGAASDSLHPASS